MNRLLDHLPSRTAFWMGLVGGVLTLCTVGFVVLLVVVLRGGSPARLGGSPSAAVAAASSPGAPAPAGQAPSGKVRPADKSDHVRGDLKKAKVVLIEYSDLECPFCKKFHPTTQELLKAYGDKVALVYRHFPLSFHANAAKEAEATECAAELGGNNAFWNYVDKIFERTTANGTGFALDALVPLAKELGLNESKFKECLDSGKMADRVSKDLAEGGAAGVNGTPATFVVPKDGNTQLVPGALPLESFKQLIDPLL